MSMTRKQFVVRGRYGGPLGDGGSGVRRRTDGSVRHPPRVRPRRCSRSRGAPPSPSSERRPMTGTSRASSSTDCGSSGPTCVGSASSSSRTSSSSTRAPSINTDPRMVVATANAIRRLGPRGGRRRGPGSPTRRRGDRVCRPVWEKSRRCRRPLRRPQRRAARRTPVETRTRGSRSSGCRAILPRDRGHRVSMPKLKTHHWAGATLSLKNLLRHHARSRLRLAEGRASTAAASRAILDIAATVRPPLAVIDGDRRHGGRRPDHGRPVSIRVWSSSRATSSPPTSPAPTDGNGSREGRVPEGGGPLPRTVALGAHRAAR